MNFVKLHIDDMVDTSRQVGLEQVLHSQLPVTLRHETPTQYPCCVGNASE